MPSVLFFVLWQQQTFRSIFKNTFDLMQVVGVNGSQSLNH